MTTKFDEFTTVTTVAGLANIVGWSGALLNTTCTSADFIKDLGTNIWNNLPFTPSDNSLLGFDSSGIVENITTSSLLALSAGVLTIAPTAVTSGTYTYPTSITVSATGQVTAITGSSGYPIQSITGTPNEIGVTAGVNPIISIATNPILPGNVTATGGLTTQNNILDDGSSGNALFNNDVTIVGNLNPATDGNSNMGAPGLNWGSAYIDILHIDNQMFLSDYPGTPSAPPSGFTQIYSNFDSGTGLSVPYYQDEAGNTYPWSKTSGTVTSITAGNSVVCTPNPIISSGTIDTIQDIRTSASPTFSGVTASSTGGVRMTVVSTTAGASNLADLYLTRGDEANGYARVIYTTGTTDLWSVGVRSGDNIYRIFDEASIATRLSINQSGAVNIPGLTASQAVVTDSSKNLISLAYTSANTASTLVERDASGNFSAGTITASLSGNATSATTATTATNATNTAITDDNSTNSTMYPTWVTTNAGNLPQKVSSTKLTFNPSTATLTTTNYIGSSLFAGGSSGGTLSIGGGSSSTQPNNILNVHSSLAPGQMNVFGNLIGSQFVQGNHLISSFEVISYQSGGGASASSVLLQIDGSSNPTISFGTGGAALKYISSVLQTSVPIVAITKAVTGSSYTTLSSDYIIAVNFAGAVTITLNASPVAGQTYIIVDESGAANTNNITISAAAGINGGTTLLIQQSYGSISVYFHGTQWYTC